MRVFVRSSSYKKYAKALLKKYSKYSSKIKQDLKLALILLSSDQTLSDRYKAHKVSKSIWEIHLVSYSSDYLLLYEKKDTSILYLYALTDHNGMNKFLHGSVIDDLLYEEEWS